MDFKFWNVLLFLLIQFCSWQVRAAGEFTSTQPDSLYQDSIGRVYLKAFNTAYEESRYADAIEHLQKADSVFQEIGNHTREILIRYYISRLFFTLSQYDSAIYYAQLVIPLIQDDPAFMIEVNRFISKNYREVQNIDEAQKVLFKSIELARGIGDSLSLANLNNDLALIYLNYHVRNKYQAAIHLLRSVTNTYADSSFGNPASELRADLAFATISLGVAYEYTSQWEKAIDAYRRSGEIYLEYYASMEREGRVDADLRIQQYSFLFNVRNNMANAYAFLGKYSDGEEMQAQAESYLEKLCALDANLCMQKQILHYTTASNLAANQGDYQLLEGNFRQLFEVLIPGYGSGQDSFFPEWEKIMEIPEQDRVLEAMVDWCAYWEESDLPPGEKYAQSIPMYELADRLVDEVLEYQSSRDAVAFWRSTVMRLYQNAFEMSASKGDIETAFYFAEKSKAAGLLANILASRQGTSIDQTERQKIHCRKQIDSLRLLLNTQGIAQPERNAIRRQLDSLQLECNPLFFRKGQGVFQSLSDYIIATDSLRGYLAPDQATVEYFDTEQACYAILIAHDTVLLERLSDINNRDSLVRKLISLVYEVSGSAVMNVEETNETLSALYKLLIQPFEGFIQNKRLIIVPAGTLFKVPFNALLRKVGGKTSYLVETNSVQTVYSLSFLYESTKVLLPSGPNKVLAMAPEFEIDSSNAFLPPLVFSVAEVEGISEQVTTKKVIGGSNLKEEFLQIAPGYQCLALSTHGKANDIDGMQSFVAFGTDSTEWLYAGEIYSKSIPAELLTLSACETAVGNYETGEGVISMSYAFRQAGVQSLVTTLWSVNDRTSAELMVSFYRGLAKGMTKDRALAEAQRDYLATTIKETIHPFFWAGFTLIGDASPLDLPRPNPLGHWWVAALFIMIPGLIYFLWRRRKRNIPVEGVGR